MPLKRGLRRPGTRRIKPLYIMEEGATAEPSPQRQISCSEAAYKSDTAFAGCPQEGCIRKENPSLLLEKKFNTQERARVKSTASSGIFSPRSIHIFNTKPFTGVLTLKQITHTVSLLRAYKEFSNFLRLIQETCIRQSYIRMRGLSIFAFAATAYAVVFDGPAPTPVDPDALLKGFSAKPTDKPRAVPGLFRRQSKKDSALCGYLQGDSGTRLLDSINLAMAP